MKQGLLVTFAALLSIPAWGQAMQLPTSVLDDPKALREIAAIYAKQGNIEKTFEMTVLIDQAKRRAGMDMLASLVQGNVDRAMNAHDRSGGTPFAVRPVKVNPKDPNDHKWRVQYQGSDGVVIDAKEGLDMAQMLVQSGNYDIGNGLSDAEIDRERRAMKEERELRMQLMQEQRRALREQSEALEDQRRMMRSQDLRNDLQSLEMLGGRSGRLPPLGY